MLDKADEDQPKILTTTQNEGTTKGEHAAHMEVTSKMETHDAGIAMAQET